MISPISYLRYILFLIFKNVGKTFILVLIFTSFFFADTFEDDRVEKYVISELHPSVDEWIYVCKSGNMYSLYKSDSKMKIENDKISYYTYDGYNVFCWVVFGFSSLIFIVITAMGEFEWEFRDHRISSLMKEVRCVDQDNYFYYILHKRLLVKSDNLVGSYSVKDLVGEFLDSPKAFPKWKTRSEKRENVLSKILA